MTCVIAVVSQKGGVGKSTTAQMIGDTETSSGRSVLFIDLDAQCNLTYSLTGTGSSDAGSYELIHGTPASKLIMQTDGHGDLIPSSQKLSGLDLELSSTRGRQSLLRNALSSIRNDYDYIILDTPPAVGNVLVNALTAADFAIIPAQADIFSLQGLGQLSSTVEAVKSRANPGLQVAGIVLQRFNRRTVLSKDLEQMLENTAAKLNTQVIGTIRDAVAVREAQATQSNIYDYTKRKRVHDDIKQLIQNLEEQING